MPLEDSPNTYSPIKTKSERRVTNKSSIGEEHSNSIQEVNTHIITTTDIALSAIQDNPDTLMIGSIPVALSAVKKDEKLNYFTGAIQSENEEDEDEDKDD